MQLIELVLKCKFCFSLIRTGDFKRVFWSERSRKEEGCVILIVRTHINFVLPFHSASSTNWFAETSKHRILLPFYLNDLFWGPWPNCIDYFIASHIYNHVLNRLIYSDLCYSHAHICMHTETVSYKSFVEMTIKHGRRFVISLTSWTFDSLVRISLA